MSRGAGGGGGVAQLGEDLGHHWKDYVPGSVWFYQPNNIAPPIFAAAYFASGALHAWQTYHYKSWRITLFLPWGALLMTAGFIMREIGAFNISDLGILIASVVLLLSGPPIYSGAAYFILARTLYYIPWLSPLHPGRILTTFIGVDFLIELMVANGAAKAVNTSASAAEQQAGAILIKTALILQACTFAAYVAILAIWHTRAKRAGLMTGNLRRVVAVMYASAALISVRCIYRIAEYFEGWTGELNTHEAYFYVFEGVVMLTNSVMLNFMHPGRLLPRDSRVYLAPDGLTELKGPGWRDPRRWWWQVVDPFDFGGCCRRDERYDFWNHPGSVGGEAEEVLSRVDGEAGKVETSVASEREGNGVAVPDRGAGNRSL